MSTKHVVHEGTSAAWHHWDRLPPGASLAATDPAIAHLLDEETQRQSDGLDDEVVHADLEA